MSNAIWKKYIGLFAPTFLSSSLRRAITNLQSGKKSRWCTHLLVRRRLLVIRQCIFEDEDAVGRIEVTCVTELRLSIGGLSRRGCLHHVDRCVRQCVRHCCARPLGLDNRVNTIVDLSRQLGCTFVTGSCKEKRKINLKRESISLFFEIFSLHFFSNIFSDTLWLKSVISFY